MLVSTSKPRERKIRVSREIGYGLGMTVLLQNEVVFGQVVDEVGVFVANGGEHGDHSDLDREGRALLAHQRNCSYRQQ
jgi:hypothetical protein